MNIQNPASYAILSYNFTLGGTYATATLKNATESAKATRTTLDYMAVVGLVGVRVGFD
jgi:hypothetical protein